MITRIATFRGVPLPMFRQFLGALGGRPEGEDSFVGEGWRASLSFRRILAWVYMFHEITLRIEGEEATVERILHELRVRSWTGGRPPGAPTAKG